jgi:hypothetical protein
MNLLAKARRNRRPNGNMVSDKRCGSQSEVVEALQAACRVISQQPTIQTHARRYPSCDMLLSYRAEMQDWWVDNEEIWTVPLGQLAWPPTHKRRVRRRGPANEGARCEGAERFLSPSSPARVFSLGRRASATCSASIFHSHILTSGTCLTWVGSAVWLFFGQKRPMIDVHVPWWPYENQPPFALPPLMRDCWHVCTSRVVFVPILSSPLSYSLLGAQIVAAAIYYCTVMESLIFKSSLMSNWKNIKYWFFTFFIYIICFDCIYYETDLRESILYYTDSWDISYS